MLQRPWQPAGWGWLLIALACLLVILHYLVRLGLDDMNLLFALVGLVGAGVLIG